MGSREAYYNNLSSRAKGSRAFRGGRLKFYLYQKCTGLICKYTFWSKKRKNCTKRLSAAPDQGTRALPPGILGIPELARRITTDLKAGQLHRMLSGLSGEHIMYLILCNEDAGSRDAIAAYVQTRQETKVAISGYDLINLGIKPGPVFKEIFQELLEMRMDQYIDTRQDEINQVKRWILEGRFSDAMAD